ncbi:zinc-ribbon domain-containing protein [Methanobrevibacter sp.]|uniref:zinc-ribbon domain-containing protein n=1 Tax=Methanobrevibacter sp. TaxID=66852 RepID=UPI00386A4904
MYCRHCGENNLDEAVYCKNCGKKLKEEPKKVEVVERPRQNQDYNQKSTTTTTSADDSAGWVGCCCLGLIIIFIISALTSGF